MDDFNLNRQVSPAIDPLLEAIPRSLYSLCQCVGLTERQCVKFAVCKVCYHLHRASDFDDTSDVLCKGKDCKSRDPIGKFRQTGSGKEVFCPCYEYAYRSVIDSLASFFARQMFEADIERWRDLQSPSTDRLHDVFDGKIWKEGFRKFFESPRSLGLQLNIDWYQPYKHSSLSLGVIYLAILNLPRTLRFKVRTIPCMDTLYML